MIAYLFPLQAKQNQLNKRRSSIRERKNMPMAEKKADSAWQKVRANDKLPMQVYNFFFLLHIFRVFLYSLIRRTFNEVKTFINLYPGCKKTIYFCLFINKNK